MLVDDAMKYLASEFFVEETVSESAMILAVDTTWDSKQRLFVQRADDSIILSSPVGAANELNLEDLVGAQFLFGVTIVSGFICLRHLVFGPDIDQEALRTAAVMLCVEATSAQGSLSGNSSN
jgi:hypothetical protein